MTALSSLGCISEIEKVRDVMEGMRDAINDTNGVKLALTAGALGAMATIGAMAEAMGGGGATAAPTSPQAGTGGGDSYTITMPIHIGDEKIDQRIVTISNGQANIVYDERAQGAVIPQ